MQINEILQKAVEQKVSDIFLVGGLPVTFKIYNRLVRQSEERLIGEQLNELIKQIYILGNRDFIMSENRKEDDFSFSLAGLARFRINTFFQRGSLSAVIRVLQFGIPNYKELNIPETIMSLSDESKGLVLVTGPAGSGKTTTLACIIDEINNKHEKNIITMEDPIEFVHRHNKSIVIQREISTDTNSYLDALRSSLRESPDVLLVGEMRDSETISTALTAAETGRLVISSLHTLSAADTIDRIVDSFPSTQQNQIRIQLSRVLKCIVCQQLVPGIDQKLYPAFEIMKMSPAASNMIREGRTHQLPTVIKEGKDNGSVTMNDSLEHLVKDGLITIEVAIQYSEDQNSLKKRLSI